MAFSGLILKPSSQQFVVPLARCAFGTSRSLNTTMYGFKSQLRSISTIADNKDLVDANLYKALKSEYNLSKIIRKHFQVNIPTPSFPFKPNIIGYKRGLYIQLKREFPDGEKVVLYIDIGSRKRLDYAKDENKAISIEDYKTPALPVQVLVQKRNNEYFFVNIRVCTENIIIENINKGYYSSAENEELDDELQQALTEYLNVRGVNRETMCFLLEVVNAFNQKADFLALKHFMKVVK